MDLHQSLQALGIDDLADITLNKLEDKIQHASPNKIPKQSVLQVFMGWLHEWIKKDIQQKSLLLEFANLLLTSGKLQQGPFTEDEIGEALKEWQTKDAAESPANIRRYQMVQLDLHGLFEQYRHSSKTKKHSPTRSPTPGQDGHSLVHIDELVGSQATVKNEIREPTPSWIVGGGKQKTGANDIPLGRKVGTRTSIYNEIVKIKEDNKKKNSTKTNKAPPMKQTAKSGLKDVTLRELSPANTYKSILLDYSSSNMPSYLTIPPPRHWIQLCPTNLDPEWDQAPPYYYRCEICKVSGKHFATLCPLNEYEFSLTQQRLRIKIPPKTPIQDQHSHYRDRSPFTPSPRGHSQSPTYPLRRKKHNAYRQDESPEDRTRSLGDRYQSLSDRRSVSPWSARERMTQETFRREESPHEHSSSHYHLRKRSGTPPRNHRKRIRAPLPEERSRPFLYLNKTKRGAEEGRLGYDNDEFMGSYISPTMSKDNLLPKNLSRGTSESEDELMADPAPLPENTVEDIEKAKKEANEFLDALAIELSLDDTQVPPPVNDISADDYSRQLDKMDIDDIKEEDSNEDSLKSAEIADQRLLQGPQFGPEAISVSRDRTNPIVHSKAERKTAKEMTEEAWKPT
ncbi:hypothetical protein F4811DRAFT_568451 [Daldinia bambusicola]|nr:hypothetical protein F4811DRAFT_568451 [Daldinia bambusicola]